MAVTAVPGQPTAKTVLAGDEFVVMAKSGVICCTGSVTVQSRYRSTDPFRPHLDGNAAIMITDGCQQLDFSASGCELKLVGTGTNILVVGLIG